MKSKTHTLINGVAFLTISGIVVKVLGLVCKIPLVHVIGEDGMGYFNSAYTIYNLFFMLSNAGLPVAISIIVAQYRATNDEQGAARVFGKMFLAVLSVGLGGCILLLLFSKRLAMIVGNQDAYLCIAVMAPVFLFVCVAGGLRGYFQGVSELVPTGVSQMIEALCKTVGCVAFAYYGIWMGYSISLCAALSLLGIAIGGFFSMAYLLCLSIKRRAFSWRKSDGLSNMGRSEPIFRRLFAIAFPVTLGSLVVSLSNFLDLTAVMRGLESAGLTAEQANRLYGNYTGLAVPLFNLPPVLIMPIACAAVPSITAARTRNDRKAIEQTALTAMKAVSVITLPCVFGLFLLSRPVLLILFEKEAALRAAPLLSLLAPAVFFVGIVTVTASILQAYGKQTVPVVSMICGAAVKLIVSLILIPQKGIVGAPIGTLCCYSVIAVINLAFCIRYCDLKIKFMKQFWLPLVSALGSTLLGRALYLLSCRFLSVRMAALLAVIFIAVLYFFMLILFSVISKEEMNALPIPKGIKEKILRFMP